MGGWQLRSVRMGRARTHYNLRRPRLPFQLRAWALRRPSRLARKWTSFLENNWMVLQPADEKPGDSHRCPRAVELLMMIRDYGGLGHRWPSPGFRPASSRLACCTWLLRA